MDLRKSGPRIQNRLDMFEQIAADNQIQHLSFPPPPSTVREIATWSAQRLLTAKDARNPSRPSWEPVQLKGVKEREAHARHLANPNCNGPKTEAISFDSQDTSSNRRAKASAVCAVKALGQRLLRYQKFLYRLYERLALRQRPCPWGTGFPSNFGSSPENGSKGWTQVPLEMRI